MADTAAGVRSELAAHMGISEETLNRALGKDRKNQGVVNELSTNLNVLFGSTERVGSFLHEENPELEDRTPVDYLENGEPQVVLNLVHAIRENLP